ncbi:hypothetical protein OJ998_01830 [Solirubrobacter taibaiensis]|nr:hypothetical protein [Solirubrobacter taibaiensis]
MILQAAVLADQVYRDARTGKHVVAGTFHQLEVASVPATFTGPATLFLALRDVDGPVELRLVDDAGEVVLGPHAVEIERDLTRLPIEYAVQLPPLPLARTGHYALQVAAGGTVLGEAPIEVVTAA